MKDLEINMVRNHRPAGKQGKESLQNGVLSDVMGIGNQEMDGEL